jgi:hypothetical protein
MDGQQHERRQFFRGKSRPGRVMPVRYRTSLHPAWIIAETRNIGVGGAFLAGDTLQPVGTALTVELSLPTSDQIFALPAIVRWSVEGQGMGIQFVGVDVDVMLELNDYFSTLV